MAYSFAGTGEDALLHVAPTRRRVLVTGAAGRIGSYFAQHAHQKYDLRLLVLPTDQTQHIQGLGEIIEGDLGNLDQLKGICQGIDTVVHMAATPDPAATWSAILPANIIGTYHLFVAAKAAGCRRVVYASSIQAVSGYPPDVQVKTSEPVNPGDLYGVSKCFGEALARYMAEQEGLSAIALRIGAFESTETARQEGSLSMLDAWVSRRDLQQLIERCVDVEGLRFAIFHAISNNRFKRLDISDARELVGYDPQDDLTAINPQLQGLDLQASVRQHDQSGDRSESGLREDL